MVVICIVVASWAMASMATMEDDEKECDDQLANLASCIPFVSGTAKKPTPQCCQDTQKVKPASLSACAFSSKRALTPPWAFLSIPLWLFKCHLPATLMLKCPIALVCPIIQRKKKDRKSVV